MKYIRININFIKIFIFTLFAAALFYNGSASYSGVLKPIEDPGAHFNANTGASDKTIYKNIDKCLNDKKLPARSAKVPLKSFAVPHNDIKGLKNFAKISEVLYRGEQPTREGFLELKKMGVKTVLSLRAFHSDRALLQGTGLYYKRMGIYTWNFKDDFTVKFLKLVTNPLYQPIFIHCQHGSDRTGTMCAVYRIIIQDWTVNDAIEEMHNFGFHEIWANLKKYLRSLDTKKIKLEVERASSIEVELIK